MKSIERALICAMKASADLSNKIADMITSEACNYHCDDEERKLSNYEVMSDYVKLQSIMVKLINANMVEPLSELTESAIKKEYEKTVDLFVNYESDNSSNE